MKLAKYRNRRVTGRKITGFTLVELIVVITILAILATIGFLALSGYSQDAKDSSIKANVRSVQTAIVSEAALTNNSPRYYVTHDADYALSGAFAYVDGSSVALTGWDVGSASADSNYTAWKPNWTRLKLNPDKFKVSGNLPRLASAGILPAEASYDPASLMAAGADFSLSEANGKKRTASYVQVGGLSPATKSASISGNFPTSNVPAGNVSGLLRAVPGSATNLTWALVDGSSTASSSTQGDILWDDSAGRKWKDGSIALSCNGYRTPSNGMAYVGNVGDGTYWIDPDGGSTANAIKVYCDMTTDGGGWTMVYKKSTGVASANPTNDFVGGTLNESDATLLNKAKSLTKDYSNRLASTYWTSATYARVEFVTWGTAQKYMKYSTSGTTNSNWYNKAKLLDSSYTDLVSGTQNFWSVAGDTTYSRTFFINSSYGGCALDVGWAIVNASSVPAGCSWEAANTVKYSTASTAQNWTSGSMGVADAMIIMTK